MTSRLGRFLILGALLGAAATTFLFLMLTDAASGNARTSERPEAREAAEQRAAGSGTSAHGAPAREAGILELIRRFRATTRERPRLGKELLREVRAKRAGVTPEVKRQLLQLLTAVEPPWRPLVGQVLGALQGDADTARSLVGLVLDASTDHSTRNAALKALGLIGVEAAVPELEIALREGYANEDLVVHALGQIGGAAASRVLLEHLDTPLRATTRLAIESALGQATDPAVQDAVARALDEARGGTRASLIAILGNTGNAKYAAKVRRILEVDGDPDVGRAAMTALARFGDEQSAAALVGRIARGGETGNQALDAIRATRNPDTLERLGGQWDDLSPSGRVALLETGKGLVKSGAFRDLASAALRDPDPGVRSSAVQYLGQRGEDGGIQPLVDFVRRAHEPGDKALGFQALLRIRSRAAAQAGLTLLEVLPREHRRSYRERCERILSAAE